MSTVRPPCPPSWGQRKDGEEEKEGCDAFAKGAVTLVSGPTQSRPLRAASTLPGPECAPPSLPSPHPPPATYTLLTKSLHVPKPPECVWAALHKHCFSLASVS